MTFKQILNEYGNRISWRDLFVNFDYVGNEQGNGENIIHARRRPKDVLELQDFVMSKNNEGIDWVMPGVTEHTPFLTMMNCKESVCYYKDNKGHVIRAWKSKEGYTKAWDWNWQVMYVDDEAFNKEMLGGK